MAGSYEHILCGWNLIENMGDACEAVHEMLWLIQSQIGTEHAKYLLEKTYYPMAKGEKEKDKDFKYVSTLMGGYW